MSKNLLLVYLFIFSLTKVQAFAVSGFVEDKVHHLPVAGAVVFIDNTQKFCITDSSGNFKLNDIQLEYFDLIVAAKGFENISYRFDKNLINKKIHFQLIQSSIDSSFISGTGNALKEKYNQWINILYERFFSDSINKNYNYILNPEALRFNYDSNKQILKVKATDKILFLNELSGYMMNIFIDDITISNDDLSYSIYTYYSPLKFKNDEAFKDCNARRTSIYKTSLLHFIRALYQNNLSQEGFKISRINRSFEGSEEYNKYTQKFDVAIFKDSLISSLKFIYTIDKNSVSEKDILEKDTSGAVFINPDKIKINMLYVLCRQANIPQYTMLFFAPDKKIRIESNGMFFEPFDVTMQGIWHSIKLEALLPYDYNGN